MLTTYKHSSISRHQEQWLWPQALCVFLGFTHLGYFMCSNFAQASQSLHWANVNHVLYMTTTKLRSSVVLPLSVCRRPQLPHAKWRWVITASPCNVHHCEHEKVQPMSRCFPLTSEGSMIAVLRQLGETAAQKKGILSGPEIGSRNAWTHIQNCPHVNTDLPLIPSPCLLLTSLCITLFCFFPPIEAHNLDPEKDHRLGENRNSEQRLFEREQEPGAEAGMRQVFFERARVCVRALKVHTYAVCTVSDVCFLHQWSCCCRGWCSAVLFRAAADARPICLGTLAQLLAFCCSTDGDAWRNIGES